MFNMLAVKKNSTPETILILKIFEIYVKINFENKSLIYLKINLSVTPDGKVLLMICVIGFRDVISLLFCWEM